MAKKKDIGLVVAESMKEIMDSDEHQWLFGKAAAKKKCCACDKKCSRKCPCKTDGGCKKSCACCEALAKKAEETSKCCTCEFKCFEKCPCKHKNSNQNSGGDCSTDCSMCGDGMMLSTSAFDMIEELLDLSEKQEKLGLDKSSEASLKLANFVFAEFKKKAQLPLDENDVTSLDLFEEDPSASINDMVEDGSDTPNLDDALQDILNKHPDFINQFRRRLRESEPEPVGSESNDFDLESTLQDMEAGEDSLRSTEFAPSSPFPGHGPTPPDADELAELAEAELASGRNIYKMHKEPFSMSEEELDDAINDARKELAKSYPEASKDNDLERSRTTEVTATDIMNMSVKFANEECRVMDDSEDDGDVALNELFPSDSASVDDLINDVLHSSDSDLEEDDLDEDEELADLAEKMTETMSHWTGGQGDPLYGVMSLFKARRTPDLDNVATARDIVESLFNKQLNSDELDMDSASELNEIHTFLVDYLTAKGYPEPGDYLDSDIEAGDSESDALIDTYMDMLGGKPKSEDSDEYFGESDFEDESPTTLRSMNKKRMSAISKF